ncbi:MAG: proton-conducting transporter membrane subunit, partial [Phycisphaeraceae bacterium]
MIDPQLVLPTIVFVPFAAAVVALLVGRLTGRRTGVLMVLSAVLSFGLAAWLFATGTAHEGEAVAFHVHWVPELGINLRLLGDQFGLFFAMLISGIGALVGIYSLAYIPDLAPNRLGQYYAALIAFMGSMLGVALADDLFLLFVFWEITSITSFILIGFWYERDDARKGAMTALQVTALGGLAMMAGFVLLGVVTGTYTISELASDTGLQQKLGASALFVPALLLVLIGAFTKSAQWPFHFWLPGAMVAPTPVSTYLHAAAMVKAGIFLVGRMAPVFEQAACWSPILITFGLVTFALGAYQAFKETDLKAILARSTFSTLGLVMLVYGLKASDQDALQILNHAVYKGALFLVAGIVEHATHTRDLRQLGGLWRKMPVTFWLCVVAGLSMAGLPPFFGFLAKESFYAELLHNDILHHWPAVQWLVIAVCVASNAFIFAVSFKLIIGIFLGKQGEKCEHAHEVGPGLWMPPAVLVVLVVVMGLIYPVTGHLVSAFSSDPQADLHVSLIPALDHLGPLVLSLVTITLGILIYRGRGVVGRLQQRLDVVPAMQRVWDKGIDTINQFGVVFSSVWQNGSLRWYFSGILAFFVGISLYALSRAGLSIGDASISLANMQWYGVALCVLLAVTVITVVRAQTRLGAAIALTATGFLVSLIFVVYRSPDILLTQILIETVSTIFILLVLFFMPPFRKDRVSPVRK